VKHSFYTSPKQLARTPACRPVLATRGFVFLELGLWISGIALIALYLASSFVLEHQRSQGLASFAQTRAAVIVEDDLTDDSAAMDPARMQPDPDQNGPGPVQTSSHPIAVLRLPDVGLEVPVYADLNELNLSRGAAWIDGTAAPNTTGNMAIAAHRDRHFRPLKDVRLGDLLELESLSGPRAFLVIRILIVDPEDVSVLDDSSVSMVTLVTCYPFYFVGTAPQRYIVQAIALDASAQATFFKPTLTAPASGETT